MSSWRQLAARLMLSVAIPAIAAVGGAHAVSAATIRVT